MNTVYIFLLMQCLFILNVTSKNAPQPGEVGFPTAKELPDPDSFEVQEETPEFLQAATNGEVSRRKRLAEDQMLAENNIVAEPNSATGVHQSLLNSSSEAENLVLNAIAIEAASKTFFNIDTIDPVSPVSGTIGNVGLSKSTACPAPPSPISIFPLTPFGQKFCYKEISCETTAIYRTFDGSCNNLWFPLVGKATTPFTRLLYPAYDDCVDDPREKSVDGTDLPCAREVSQVLGSCPGSKNTANTMMMMQWGQFIDHDLAFSPTGKLSYSGQPIKCCDVQQAKFHSECFPICIAPDDPYYSCFDKTCMNFVRTLSAPSIWCNFGPREQVNDLSHFLDGSMIYGSSTGIANSLRTFSGGRLKVQKDQDKYDMLPGQTISSCKSHPDDCYRAGDGRVNEQPNLAITHTLWMREHNRIADYFHKKKGLNDEKAYQEARKLVIAEIQHITYNEFLPVVLGPTPSLEPGPVGSYFSFYSPFTDARISNEFATAAFRFGHSLLDDHIEKHWLEFSLPIQLPLSSLFSRQGLNHFWGNRNLFEFGLTRQHPEKVDMCFTKEVTQRLFEEAGIPGSGLDLVALNIQRGRDHGLPPYVEYRNNFCNSNHKIHTFDDMTWLSPVVLTLLKSVYALVEDVDLFVGGLLEPNEPLALVGETFQCIMRDQFYRLKGGDRFFYENNIQPEPFTSEQLKEIKKKVSLARIFCDNGDKITKIQAKVFSSAPKSALKKCSGKKGIPKLNLKLFP